MMAPRDRHIAGEHPWGWWLRSNKGALEDEDGRLWSSVREAFWEGELGFSNVHFGAEQHELLLRVLSSIDVGWVGVAESQHDLFRGDMMFWRFYQCWLGSIGMLDLGVGFHGRANPLEARLSPHGRSVLMMLRATREPAWAELPMQDVLDAVAASRRGPADEARDRYLRAFEDAVGLRRHVFARESVGNRHLVTLTALVADAPVRMPVRRVTWSISFVDARVRDEFFGWLAIRVALWDDWGHMAYQHGASAWTRHLLSMVLASNALDAPS